MINEEQSPPLMILLDLSDISGKLLVKKGTVVDFKVVRRLIDAGKKLKKTIFVKKNSRWRIVELSVMNTLEPNSLPSWDFHLEWYDSRSW